MIKIIPRDKIKHLEWQEGEKVATQKSNTNTSKKPTPTNINFGKMPEESFIMSYDCPTNKEFYQELITKVNEVYKGTNAEIPTGTSGEVQGNLIKRMGIISTIANDSNLRSYGLFPITPAQSEYLLKNGKLTNPRDNWEDLALLLYDIKGENKEEAKYLKESILKNKDSLGLSDSDLEKRLVICNAGLETDSSFNNGVKPIIIPGITQVYSHEILDKTGENHNFEYALENGLPTNSEIKKGSRTIYMPSGDNIGLRLLYRYRNLCLDAWDIDLAYSYSDGRVNFARSAST